MNMNVKALQRFLAQQAGLAFPAEKAWLAESRLQPVAERHGLPTIDALIGQIVSGFEPLLAAETVEAMLTHETFFFRDRMPFDQFRTTMLPDMMRLRDPDRRIRIWSAACSTGQEPYSLAMLLDEEARKLNGWRVELLASDISASVIEVAKRGLFSQFEVQRGLPINHLLRYFHRAGEYWEVAEHIRARIEFRQINLMSNISRLGQFDIIFCRNVLIYFDDKTRASALAQLTSALAPGGYLVLGASESLPDCPEDLNPMSLQNSIFRKVEAGPPLERHWAQPGSRLSKR